ncbi:MAG TPA: 1,4-dihydroxy-2-naphthoate octaprenyltransferase [Candidatus Avisuccinivibrio pullicola]|nr:1,4-dihydroxy-2-naphthoate octaprenyltransferase [Candidatus Avisuccinivibrio pullicola]
MLKDWLSEARPRTLLLGGSNCAAGCALGFYYGAFNLYTLTMAVLIVLTGVFLQILSNFANDYGDAFRGADRDTRLGPIRAVMEGGITLNDLRRGMAIVVLLATLTGGLSVSMAFYGNLDAIAVFLFLGVVSIVAALLYTMGVAYGYRGLGDVAVFLFFGLLAVMGPQLMLTSAAGGGVELYPDAVALGVSVGTSSVMVLHVANMRDIAEDRLSGKHTIASRLGARLSSIYHAVLFAVTVLASFAACFMSHKGWEIAILAVALMPLMASMLRVVKNASDARLIGAELKFTVMGCALHNIGWMVVLIIDFWYYFT